MFGFQMSVIVLIILTGTVCSSATSPLHNLHFIYGCYDSGEVRVDVLVDEDVAGYADFSKEEIVWVLPHLPPSIAAISKERAYEIAKASIIHCQSVLGKSKRADPGAALRQDAPGTSMYTRYEGEDGVVNTLFCLADHFYPPTINFTWTKNGVEATDGVSYQRYHQNRDGTFHRISTLSFTPRVGDVYSCSVEHQALQEPLIRSWELEERKSGVSPAAGLFMASLVFCMIGIGVGVFLCIKQPN